MEKSFVVEAAIGVGADEERDAPSAPDVVLERSDFVISQTGHIEQINGRLLVKLFGVGQETGRLDVWLPSGSGVAAGGEGKRKLVTAAAVFRAVDDQDRTGGGEIAGEVAAV